MEISLIDFVSYLIYGSFLLVLIQMLLLRYERMKFAKHKKQYRVICRMCQHAYEDTNSDRVSHCPHCGILNSK